MLGGPVEKAPVRMTLFFLVPWVKDDESRKCDNSMWAVDF